MSAKSVSNGTIRSSVKYATIPEREFGAPIFYFNDLSVNYNIS